MSEQWFLDLDGVRSGPYQTSEVMSLVAEGEILPHHQIAMDLKSQKWMTILEWRLNQNRNAEPKKEIVPPTVTAVSPVQEKPAIVEKPTPVIPVEKPAAIEKPVITETPPPAFTREDIVNTKPKRDPMAEMFDMLQNTKQKREVKAQTHAAQAHAQINTAHSHATATSSATTPSNSNSKSAWGKTIIIGLIITIIGFALGQLFQHQSQKPVEPPVVLKTTTTPATNNDAPIKTTDETGREVLEARTDKMIIRVPVNKENAAPSPSPEHGKDIQELKELKKELLELKALKEEIRGSNNSNDGDLNGRVAPSGPGNKTFNENYDMENGDVPTDDNGNPINPEETTHY